MTDVVTPGAHARLYSQTPSDERGNFRYQGDLYKPGEQFSLLAARIDRHLAAHFPTTKFAITTQKFAGGRKVTAEIIDTPDDLSNRNAQNDIFVKVRDQMERFGFINANLLQDFYNCSFYCEAKVGQAYWSALARRRGVRNPVEAIVPLAAFKKWVKAGDSLKLIDAPEGHRALGTTRAITKVRSGDLILEGQS